MRVRGCDEILTVGSRNVCSEQFFSRNYATVCGALRLVKKHSENCTSTAQVGRVGKEPLRRMTAHLLFLW